MEWTVRPVSLALLGLASVLLLASAAGLFTGDPDVLTYAVPTALAGLAAAFLGVRLPERNVETAT